MKANYKISERAREDMKRIYAYGVETFGVVSADEYYNDLFDRFEKISADPYMYPIAEDVGHAYRRSVCGVYKIYY